MKNIFLVCAIITRCLFMYVLMQVHIRVQQYYNVPQLNNVCDCTIIVWFMYNVILMQVHVRVQQLLCFLNIHKECASIAQGRAAKRCPH